MNKVKSCTISEFSEKITKYQGLPRGTEIRFYNKKTERRVRSDFTLKRRNINRKNLRKIDSGDNVKSYLDLARSIISTEIEVRGMEIRLYSPDGARLNGNMLISNVRALVPKDSETAEIPFEIFSELLESCGIEDCTIRQVGALYSVLGQIVGVKFDSCLLAYEKAMQSA